MFLNHAYFKLVKKNPTIIEQERGERKKKNGKKNDTTFESKK